MDYIFNLKRNDFEKLCKDLHLGDFENAETSWTEEEGSVLILTASNTPPTGATMDFLFNAHGLVNAGFYDLDKTILKDNNEFQMMGKFPLSAIINEAFMVSMSEIFPTYLKDESKHREQTVSALISASKQNKAMSEKIDRLKRKHEDYMDNLMEREYDKALEKYIRLCKLSDIIKGTAYYQFEEAVYNAKMYTLSELHDGKDIDTVQDLIGDYRVSPPSSYEAGETFLSSPAKNTFTEFDRFKQAVLNMAGEMLGDDDEQEYEEDYSYEFENNPELENYLPADSEDQDDDCSENY